MKGSDLLWVSGLGGLAAWIWLRDPVWQAQAADTLPILAALPLFAWLGAPWHLVKSARPLSPGILLGGGVLLLAGALGNLTLLMALGWTLLLWAWLQPRIDPARAGPVRRLLVLPAMAFPWIAGDADVLGWWFRLSAAGTAETMFAGLGLSVARTGTNLVVQGAPIAVAPACSGLGTLQAMLLAGCALAYIYFGRDGGLKYWLSLPALVVVSWLANTLRVLAIAAAALSFGPAFAAGEFHRWGGMAVLCTMFGLCWCAFTLLRRLPTAAGGSPA
jgi:exosortase/archaeosortase family protein